VYSTIKEEITSLLHEALLKAEEKGMLPPIGKSINIPLETPRYPSHGDLSSSIAFLLTQGSSARPIEVAHSLVGLIQIDKELVGHLEVAGRGFINFFIAPSRLHRFLREFDEMPLPDIGKGRRVLIEFVSSNPTGPLHVGHGRGAVLGDVLANLLEATGFKAEREYYINDVGNQIQALGRSLKARYLELLGVEHEWPEDGYQGEYLIEIARALLEERKDGCQDFPVDFFAEYALGHITEEMKTTLLNFGVRFDHWISEKGLYKMGTLNKTIQDLKERGYIYEQEGAFWFRASLFGDEKDRVLIRETGEPTYFAGDLAYHLNKYKRGYDRLINIWGQDHHGYAPRIKAAISAFGYSKDTLDILLYQMVSLLRDGKPVAMSTRRGEFVTLSEILEEVGRDAARFYYLMQSSRAHLDFDLELAKQKSTDNPVYYVQYAHARISSIFAQASKRGIRLPPAKEVNLSLLNLKEELEIITKLETLREEITNCVINYEIHRLTTYLIELVSKFHSYYKHHRIISQDLAKTAARLILVRTVQMTIKKVLGLLGISAPERM